MLLNDSSMKYCAALFILIIFCSLSDLALGCKVNPFTMSMYTMYTRWPYCKPAKVQYYWYINILLNMYMYKQQQKNHLQLVYFRENIRKAYSLSEDSLESTT